MKRTTYIFIGLLVSGLIVVVATIIFVSTSGKPYWENGAFLGDEQVNNGLEWRACCEGICQPGWSV